MTDPRVKTLAKILVEHSANIVPGDRVLLEGTTAAEPLIEALYKAVLERGGLPYPLFEFPNQTKLLLEYGSDTQIGKTPPLREIAYQSFESRIKILSEVDLTALAEIDPAKQSLLSKSAGPILATQFRRGAAKEFKWVTTIFPTKAYADQAQMSLSEYEDFVYSACYANGNTQDAINYWTNVKNNQVEIVARLSGHDQVIIKGSNVDLQLSIKDRVFINSWGRHNMPDGEIHTSPIENSVNGWINYSFPGIKDGRVVEDIELVFKDGRVENAKASKNQDYLISLLDTDEGSRYVGEFAIGTNYEISKFTGNILFDEKIGGTFHMAVGAGYSQTGSKNTSAIHWDMICDLRNDSEILLDGEVVYRNGEFIF